jgi:hypothetical protein
MPQIKLGKYHPTFDEEWVFIKPDDADVAFNLNAVVDTCAIEWKIAETALTCCSGKWYLTVPIFDEEQRLSGVYAIQQVTREWQKIEHSWFMFWIGSPILKPAIVQRLNLEFNNLTSEAVYKRTKMCELIKVLTESHKDVKHANNYSWVELSGFKRVTEDDLVDFTVEEFYRVALGQGG